MTSKEQPKRTRAAELVETIEQDMQRRGLKPGDRYLTARQAAEQFGVSSMTANRAMWELARRGVLVRKQRIGTFLGPAAVWETTWTVRSLILLMPPGYVRTAGPMTLELMRELHAQWPEDALQTVFTPAGTDTRAGASSFMRYLVRTQRPRAFVLFVSSPELQTAARHTCVPTVISGSPHPNVPNLTWVDGDHRAMGRLLADFVLTQTRGPVQLLMGRWWGAEDRLFIDGLLEVLEQHRLDAQALGLVCREDDASAARQILDEVLADHAPPLSFLCRSSRMAHFVAQAAYARGLRVPQDLLIVHADAYRTLEEDGRFPAVRPAETVDKQAKALVHRLRLQHDNGIATPPPRSVPVVLDLPDDFPLVPHEPGLFWAYQPGQSPEASPLAPWTG